MTLPSPITTATDLPEGVSLTSDIVILNANAMALGKLILQFIVIPILTRLGATRTACEQSVIESSSQTSDDQIVHHITTRTIIAFEFVDPCLHSPYSPPPGVSLEEAARVLLSGRLPASGSLPLSPTSSESAASSSAYSSTSTHAIISCTPSPALSEESVHADSSTSDLAAPAAVIGQLRLPC
jgi:hypothetical protein